LLRTTGPAMADAAPAFSHRSKSSCKLRRSY